MTALLDTSTVIVGQSGSGKTVTAKEDVRQLLEQRRHTVIIDPTGVWWGMRADAAGGPNGAQLYIFGGDHGDVAIRPDQGAAIARIIVEQRVSAIVDLSAIDNSADWRLFVHDFVAELRRAVNGNFHLVVDEADEFAPERPPDDIGFALRENMVWIAKRGRVRGFVPTYITQRTAEIAKAVISQAQTIVAHQLIAPSDQKAIDDYLKGHGSADVRKQVMSSLAELQVGERWIYSPRLKVLEHGITPALTTFDSSRTPAPGEQLVEPRTLAELDVSAIAAALAPVDVPGDAIPADALAAYRAGSAVGAAMMELERRIEELEGENATLLAKIERFRTYDHQRDDYFSEGMAAIAKLLDEIATSRFDLPAITSPAGQSEGPTQEASHVDRSAARAELNTASSAGAHIGSSADDASDRDLKALAGLIAVYPAGLTEAAWSTRTGYSRKGGAWMRRRKRYLDDGWIVKMDGRWHATPAGIDAAGETIPVLPPPGLALVKFWADRQDAAAARILQLLAKIHPRALTRDTIAIEVNMAVKGGAFSRAISALKSAELIRENQKRLAIAAELLA